MFEKIKHIILLLCMLVSVNQSVHILSHVFSSHDDVQSELVHINDHKCQLCHVDVQSLIPHFELENFQWIDSPKQSITYFYFTSQQNQFANQYFSLRAPPSLI